MNSIQNIERELNIIHAFVIDSLLDNAQDVELIITRSHKLLSYLARTGSLLAESKKLRDIKMNQMDLKELMNTHSKSSTLVVKFADSKCADENFCVNLAYTTFESIKRQLDIYRSIISKTKDEYKQFNNNI